jgi:hypothetical protein
MTTAAPVWFRDAGNRSVSDEEIALRWIATHPQLAAQALGRRPPPARRMAISTKSADGQTVSIQPADPDEDEG